MVQSCWHCVQEKCVFLSLSVLGQVVLCCDPLNKVLRKFRHFCTLDWAIFDLCTCYDKPCCCTSWLGPWEGDCLPVSPMIGGCFPEIKEQGGGGINLGEGKHLEGCAQCPNIWNVSAATWFCAMPRCDIAAGVLWYLLQMIPCLTHRRPIRTFCQFNWWITIYELCCVISQAPHWWEGLQNDFAMSKGFNFKEVIQIWRSHVSLSWF